MVAIGACLKALSLKIAAGGSLLFPNILPDSGQFSTSATGFVSDFWKPEYVPLLSYLLQAWYCTAGKLNYTQQLGPTPIDDVGSISTVGTTYRRIYWDADEVDYQGSLRGFNPQTSRYGWLKFTYPTGDGPLKFITYPHQYFEPESPGATGVSYSLYFGMTGALTTLEMDDPLPGFTYTGGWSMNPSHDDQIGWQEFIATIPTVTLSEHTLNIQMPLLNAPLIHLGAAKPVRYDADNLYPINEGVFVALVFDLLAEIWQATAQPTAYVNTVAGIDISVPGLFGAGGAIIKGGEINFDAPPSGWEYTFGQSSFPFLGYWSPAVNGYLGETRYCNGQNQALWGLPIDCNQIYVSSKPLVTGTMQLFTAPGVVLGTINDNGPVNLVSGEQGGLRF